MVTRLNHSDLYSAFAIPTTSPSRSGSLTLICQLPGGSLPPRVLVPSDQKTRRTRVWRTSGCDTPAERLGLPMAGLGSFLLFFFFGFLQAGRRFRRPLRFVPPDWLRRVPPSPKGCFRKSFIEIHSPEYCPVRGYTESEYGCP